VSRAPDTSHLSVVAHDRDAVEDRMSSGQATDTDAGFGVDEPALDDQSSTEPRVPNRAHARLRAVRRGQGAAPQASPGCGRQVSRLRLEGVATPRARASPRRERRS
jgi:hypothetical protein